MESGDRDHLMSVGVYVCVYLILFVFTL